MKLIHGHTLAELLAARATPAEDLPGWMGVFERVCQAVAFAHARGLIHRDLKPSNVTLLSPSVAGSATAPVGSETLLGQSRGTPAFMAPEQARGEVGRVGTASDAFGLGGILCVMLTGQPPFTRAGQSVAGDLEEAFARLDGCGADAELIALAKACLAPAQEARPADAAEVAGLVKRYRDEVAARQAEAERLLWLRAAGEALTPAAEDARARLRQQARALLRTEVAAQAQRLSSASPAEAAAARQVLEGLCGLPVLAGVRDLAALADLTETERQEWQAFRHGVEELLRGPDPAR
jgi:hypothetical protein